MLQRPGKEKSGISCLQSIKHGLYWY